MHAPAGRFAAVTLTQNAGELVECESDAESGADHPNAFECPGGVPAISVRGALRAVENAKTLIVPQGIGAHAGFCRELAGAQEPVTDFDHHDRS
jgi:hypothetical protein